MTTRQLVSVVLALLALIAGNQAAAQTQSSDQIWRDVAKVSFGDVHRRPPGAPLPPLPPDTAARWRAELAGTVRNTPASTVWDTFKANGTRVLRNPVELAKSGGRLMGKGFVFGVGFELASAALKYGYSHLTDGATLNTLEGCMAFARGNDYQLSLDMPCDTKVTTSSLAWPKGRVPNWNSDTITGESLIWWDYKYPGQRFVWQITRVTQLDVVIYANCPTETGGFNINQRFPVDPADGDWINRQYNFYATECKMTSTTTDPVYLTEFVEGNPTRNVAPHPEIKEQLKQTIVNYIENSSVQPTASGEILPGAPMDNKIPCAHWYGVPCTVNDDTDGDGWSDWEELQRGSDPDDAQSRPSPTRDTDADGATDGDEDRLGTDPYDPSSTPEKDKITDTDKDGTVDADDPDDDNDGHLDVDEIGAGSNPKDATSKPPDTDADGTPDYKDTDDDNDNVPDVNDPAPLDKTKPLQCSAGTVASQDGKTCVPKEDPANCPDGMKSDGMTPPKCVPDSDPKDPVGDTCGDLSFKRLTAHTGHWLRDVVFPCDDQDYTRLVAMIQGKFPFSLLSSLGTFFESTSGGAAASPLPNKIGPFTVDTSWAAGLLLLIKTGWRAFLWWSFFTWIAHRLSGQVVLS